MYDVVIIGAGVTGCATARELSKYQLSVCVLEKEADIGEGTSKANSGIVHAGFDAVPGSLKARLNVEGSRMMETLSKELDFAYKKNGSVVLCFEEGDVEKLERLLEQGQKNGVEGLRILTEEEIWQLEPNLSRKVKALLYAPSGGIVCPFGLTIALAENACVNGVAFQFQEAVKEIKQQKEGFLIYTSNGIYEARAVINAAGVYADVWNNCISRKKYNITARKGEYCLFDKKGGTLTEKTVFQLPTAYGKGVLVTPTVHGNLLIGPNAEDIQNKEGTDTTAAGVGEILKKAAVSVENIPYRQVITSFAGLRAHEEGDEFVIGEAEDVPGFFNILGIESPGLSSAPAIGKMAAGLVGDYLKAKRKPKEAFISRRIGIAHMAELSLEKQNALIRENPKYGNMVCRCERVTEGEIMDAIHRPLGARTLDGVKRRTRAGMGRCQAGFCTPRTMEILSRELNIPMEEITKSGADSSMLASIEEQDEKDREKGRSVQK